MNLRQHIQEQLEKDYDLLKKLEDKRRFENDPLEVGKLEADIELINQRIRKREVEIEEYEYDERVRRQNQKPSDSPSIITIRPESVGVKIQNFFAQKFTNFPYETIFIENREKKLLAVTISVVSVVFMITFPKYGNSVLEYTKNFVFNRTDLENSISLGEDAPLLTYDNRDKKYANKLRDDAKTAFQNRNYKEAEKIFYEWYEKEKLNPEALIYWLNAKALSESKNSGAGVLKIAATVPAGKTVDAAYEILRGVAKIQHDINESGGINGKKLIVLIANDNNDERKAKEIAEKLVSDWEILAVVGSNKSEASLIAAEVYKQASMVMISPTSDGSKFLQDSMPPIFHTMKAPSTVVSKLLEHIGDRSILVLVYQHE